MPVEAGQIRVWDDAITLDKTPFLVVDQIYPSGAWVNWQIIWHGQTKSWSHARIEAFSEVIDADG